MEKKKAADQTPNNDKKQALDTAIRQIEKNFGKGAVMRLGDRPDLQVDAIPTGSLALDAALGIGGVPKGRIIEIYGPESSGKTTLALHIVAQAQKRGGILRIQRMLGVYKGGLAAHLLGRSDNVQRQRRFAGGFRPVNFNDTPLGHAADAERGVQRQ